MIPLDELLDRLRQAVGHGEVLGLSEAVADAERTLDTAEQRLGFAGDTYVLALVGGTGVGKSSLLNTLAGEPVSPASAIRPTTDEPLAWVAESRRASVEPLLEWLAVSESRTHDDHALDSVAILDMPDFDSVAAEHRRTVDRLLPKVDVVLWVLDPEKYDDERLHSYLRSLGKGAEKVRFALNKTDRLSATETEAVMDDLVRRLTANGIEGAVIYPVSATTGAGTSALRQALEHEADAKAHIADKLRRDAVRALGRMAEEAGVAGEYQPLLADDSRAEYVSQSVDAAVGIVDPPGVSRQLKESLRSKASVRAGSIISRFVWLVRWLTGHRRRHADPVRYLLNWRKRGALGRVVNPIRRALLAAIESLPPQARASIGAETSGPRLETEVEAAIDRAVDTAAAAIPDRPSWFWGFLAIFQVLATAGVVLAIAWYVTLVLGPGDLAVGTVDVPGLGPVPMPLALLVISLGLSLLIAGLARLHAALVGAKQARRLRELIGRAVSESIERAGFDQLGEVEKARRALAELRAEALAR